MKQRRISRFLAFVLLVAMTLSLMPATLAFAEEPSAEEYEGGTIRAVEVPEEDPEPYEPDPDEGSIRAVEDPVDVNAEGDQTWEKVDFADVVTGDTVAISLRKSDDTTYYFISNAGTNKDPRADKTVTTADNTITPENLGSGFDWTATVTSEKIQFNNDTLYLSYKGSSTGVEVAVPGSSSKSEWSLSDSNRLQEDGSKRFLAAFSNNNGYAVRAYAATAQNLGNSTYEIHDLQLWKLTDNSGETPTPTVAAPVPSVAAGAVEAGTVVTFTTATEGATVLLSVDDGATWEAPNPYTVNEAVTIKAKAVKDEQESETVSYAYTIKPGEEPVTETGFVTDLADLTDGAKVVILNKANKMALSQEYTGYYNKGVPVAVTDDVLSGYGATEIWTIGVNEDGSYTFATADGKKLAMAATRTSMPLDEANPNWSITAADGHEDGFYIENTGRTGYRIEWYANNNNWSSYNNNATGDLFIQQFYLVGDEVPAEKPAAPVPSVAAGAVEAGTVVTFTTVTEGATVLLSVDDGATWEAPNPYTVNEAVTIKAKAVKDELESETVSFAYTIKSGETTTVTLEKLTEAPADGMQVVIHYPAGNEVLTATANGNKLSGTAATPAEGKLELTDAMAYLTVHVTENVYSFELDGSYLTSGATGNSLSFAADADSDLAKWTLEQQTDGTWYLMNVGAAYNGNHNQALEYYNGFTTYGVKTDNAQYKFDFYAEPEVVNTDPVSGLKTGDKVAIFNDGNNKALTATASGTKLAAADATLNTEGKLSGEGIALLTVTVDDEGKILFTADGKYLTSGETGGSLSFTEESSDYSLWVIEDAGEGLFFLKNANAAYNGSAQYLEYYSTFTTYGKKATADSKAYAMSFRQIAESGTPEDPTGETYGLASTLADGDTVILYNAKNGVAIGNTISSHKVSGVSLTPVDGVITTDKTAVAWKVTVNADGTYTFTQGDYTLGGVVSGTYNNLVVTEATYTNWTLTGPDATDFNYFMYLGDMANNFGKTYLEYYNGFTLYGSTAPDKDAFGITFYKKGAEPETPAGPGETGDLVTSLDQLTEGATVAIYSPGHKTAISSKPNGDWYLKANDATIENGKVVNFTDDFVWTVKRNDNGTYSFYAYGDETRSITVWPSGNYAELSLNVGTYPENTWTLTPAKTANCFYISSPTVSGTSGPAYIEAYVRNEFEVFSGYFTNTNSNKFTESEYALQFYLVNPDDAIEAFDDGEWDGVLQKGGQYVAYNAAAESSIGLFAEANYSMRAIPTTIEGGKANAGNGAYVFTVDTMGRYYTFKIGDKFFATNNSEELLFVDPNEDGSAPENAKWFLKQKENGYIIYNKDASYNGTPVCVEYYSSVFSGWTFSSKNDVNIYLFNFYEVADGTEIREGVVQDPSVIFACEDSRYVEQDYAASFSLDDLAESITNISITYTAGERTGIVTEYEVSSDGKTYSFTIPADEIDGEEPPENFKIQVNVTNSYDISYTGEKTVAIIDEPFFTELTPAPNSQTREEKRPVISARIGNVGEKPTIVMTVNEVEVEAVFENGVLSYTPAEDMADGRVAVAIQVKRADNVTAEKTWNFTVGYSAYQLYFGQLHSHTTYSDGSGDLDTALEYIASLPESANVQFVAFTDHSNYFDTTSAANPADALNDKALMTDASRALWNEYKGKVASFNENHEDLLAIAGFEMTWSGGPGHINTFDSDGLVSRNNAELNNKTGDAGMKLYYETINKGDSLNQFNHPGNTFGNFIDFSYRDEATDAHMFLVEVGNGEGQIGAGGYYPSYEQYIMALDKGWHVAPTNNQDNHKGRWGNANDARDVILTDEFTEQGIYDAIRALRVYATEDKNLQITYSVNDMPMGTIFSDEDAPEKLNAVITLYDPDASDGISKVELVANGGAVAYTWNDAADLANGLLEAELDPEYSYYFVRVTQTDGDLAVTAPVWVGHAAKLGITDIKAASEQVYVNEETTLTTTLYNNEASAATVKSLVYTINGDQVIGSDTNAYTIPAGGTVAATFKHSFTLAKLTTVTVTAIVELDGKEYTYTANVELDLLDREHANEVTSIADVRAASDPEDTGYRFIIEGVITSNASGFDKDTAFFDCIYVQDETAGICCFPVSGEYKIGDKVRIVGHTDFYQGEPELQVKTLEVIGEGTVTPTEIKASELNDRSAEGKLVTVNGTVESFEVVNGLIQTIMVKDAEGGLARVFIDGYITTGAEVVGCVEGAQISATGLASYDDTFNAPEGPFPRIRIRNRADIICSETATLEDGFYLIGPDWAISAIDAAEKFVTNPEKPEEFMLSTTLEKGDKIKVVRVENNAITGWYPEGLNNEYTVDADHAGSVDIFFKTNYDEGWSAFGGYIWINRSPVVVVGKSLSLKGNIAVNFYLDLPQGVLSDEGAYVTINNVRYLVSEAEQSEVRAATGYRFTANVKFAHLTDTLVLRVYNGKDEPVLLKDSEGNDLTETGFAYRAQDYIEYVRANSEDEGLLAVVNALSDLGSLAQAQFKYNVDSRADLVGDLASVTADMVKEHELKLTTADGAGIRYYGSSLLLKDDTTVRHYFTLETGEIGDYTFTVDGAELEPAEKGGLYYVDITGIVARDLDKSFHVEVLKGGETVIGLDYSALSYAYTTLSRGKTDTLTELAKAVVLYSEAANAYLPE